MATAKLFLDARYSSAESTKELTVKVAINHNRKSSTIATDIKVLATQWDKTTCQVVRHPFKQILNQKLLMILMQITTAIRDIKDNEDIRTLSSTELSRKIREQITPASEKKNVAKEEKQVSGDLFLYFEKYKNNRLERKSSIEKYDVCWRHIERFEGKDAAFTKDIKTINLGWIEEFDKHLSKTAPKENGRRAIHACLKAVLNYAIDYEVIDRNPYRRFKIRTNKTEKRNMSVDSLRRIIFVQGLQPYLERYRDFFVLSFMLRGLNTIDMCSIPKSEKGRINIKRSKTGQPLSIKIEPEILTLINKYRGERNMLNFAEGQNYRNFNKHLSKAMHKICEHINSRLKESEDMVPDFTMYWARHTWATIASRIGISDGIISAALGHSERSVTEIYIERDIEQIDLANRRVLDYVLYDIDYRHK